MVDTSTTAASAILRFLLMSVRSPQKLTTLRVRLRCLRVTTVTGAGRAEVPIPDRQKFPGTHAAARHGRAHSKQESPYCPIEMEIHRSGWPFPRLLPQSARLPRCPMDSD